MRLAKDRLDHYAGITAVALAAHGDENALTSGRGSAAMLAEGSIGGGGAVAKHELMRCDEGSASPDDDGGTHALSAGHGSGMSEEDELALLEAKERMRRQKDLRRKEVLA